jgi:peptidase E
MTAVHPTIVATSGGFRDSPRLKWEVGPLTEHALELARVPAGRRPRVCFLPTACADDPGLITTFYDNAWRRDWVGSHLRLLPMPNIENPGEHLAAQDLVWVWGGSVAGLLSLWRLHGLDSALRAAWQSGTILTGISAGSICWHAGGTTDSFGPELRPVTHALGFLPYSNGVHYDSEPQRRPLLQGLIGDGVLPGGYATDDGAGLVYRGTELHEVLAERPGALGYSIEQVRPGEVQERALSTRHLS